MSAGRDRSHPGRCSTGRVLLALALAVAWAPGHAGGHPGTGRVPAGQYPPLEGAWEGGNPWRSPAQGARPEGRYAAPPQSNPWAVDDRGRAPAPLPLPVPQTRAAPRAVWPPPGPPGFADPSPYGPARPLGGPSPYAPPLQPGAPSRWPGAPWGGW